MSGTKLVAYIIVGNGLLFTARIESYARVSDLIKVIKEASPSIFPCDTTSVTLFLAKKSNGWLKEGDADAKMLARGELPQGALQIMQNDENKLSLLSRVGNSVLGFPDIEDEQVDEDDIHVLVVFSGMETRAPQRDPNPLRKRKWDEMNLVFARNKKVKSNGFVGISHVPFNDVKRFIGERSYTQASKTIADEDLEVLYQYLEMLAKIFPIVESSNEATRLHFIVPVLAGVCALSQGSVHLRAESPVVGKRVHADGAFEIVLQRGDKRVCIVEAKRRDYDQGFAQAFIGSEILADVEGSSTVYTIVTSFMQWYFMRSLDDRVEKTREVSITLQNGIPTRESVKAIAEKIYAILAGED